MNTITNQDYDSLSIVDVAKAGGDELSPGQKFFSAIILSADHASNSADVDERSEARAYIMGKVFIQDCYLYNADPEVVRNAIMSKW